jgi:hypothetical protein
MVEIVFERELMQKDPKIKVARNEQAASEPILDAARR